MRLSQQEDNSKIDQKRRRKGRSSPKENSNIEAKEIPYRKEWRVKSSEGKVLKTVCIGRSHLTRPLGRQVGVTSLARKSKKKNNKKGGVGEQLKPKRGRKAARPHKPLNYKRKR